MLFEYLQQEYEKNPDQFPFNKQLIEEYMMKNQNQPLSGKTDQEMESVKDIKSQEMILEEANSQQIH